MKKNRLYLIMTILVSLMLACNVSIGDNTPPPTAVVVVVTQIVAADTATPQADATETTEPTDEPTEEPTVALTSTAATPLVTPLKDPVNCRYGPSIFFEQVYALNVGAFMPVVGKSADGGWWLAAIPNTDKKACWVGKSVTTFSGDESNIPVVATPIALITGADLRVSPDFTNVGPGCSVGPFPTFAVRGTITTNGPLQIVWHMETQQDGRGPDHTIVFPQFGTQKVSFDYVPTVWKKGNFWVRLVITSPVSMATDVTYQVKCQ